MSKNDSFSSFLLYRAPKNQNKVTSRTNPISIYPYYYYTTTRQPLLKLLPRWPYSSPSPSRPPSQMPEPETRSASSSAGPVSNLDRAITNPAKTRKLDCLGTTSFGVRGWGEGLHCSQDCTRPMLEPTCFFCSTGIFQTMPSFALWQD